MPRVKQASKKKHVMKSVPVLGAAGLTFSMVGGASAAAVPTADTALSPTVGLGHQVTLGEEEIADVSLATFHVFDKENVGSGVQVAWVAAAAVAAVAEGAEAAVAAPVGLRWMRRLLRFMGRLPLVLSQASSNQVDIRRSLWPGSTTSTRPIHVQLQCNRPCRRQDCS